jgi:Cft2 family RNA processing exonuclease
MQLSYSNFLTIKDGSNKYNIDQTKASDNNENLFITHAHSDHLCNTFQKSYATKETISLLNGRIKNAKHKFVELEYNKKLKLTNDLSVTPLNAGHILGSAMFYFENQNTSLLYTGDFNSGSSLLLKSAKPVNADILFIESTFGRKEFSFNLRSTIYSNLADKINNDISKNKFIIIGGYSLGKNQEIIAFLNQYLNIVPLVDQETYKYSSIYNKYNKNLKFNLLDYNIYASNVLVMPISLVNRNMLNSLRLQTGKIIESYVMTGWNYARASNLINISDHCDYENLLDFVNQVNPKKVYTMHGFSKEFAKSINYELGIDAKPITDLNKTL